MIHFDGKKFHYDTRYWDHPQQYTSISLYQIGDLSCLGGFEVGNHIQPCYEISYILSGKGDFYVDGKRFPVEKGDLFLCLPDQCHNLIADNEDPFRYLYLAFYFNSNLGMDNPYPNIQKTLDQVTCPRVKDAFSIELSFTALLKELHYPTDFSQQMLETYMTQIIILTHRNFQKSDTVMRKPHTTDQFGNETVYSVISYIENRIFDITSLSEIADRLNYSYSHLSCIFSNEIGMSLQTYYNQKRIDTAERLLRETTMSINDIALKLRYQSIHSFSKAFKKVTGMAPSQYRMIS
jgi:AraC-like DNA-binding protein